MDKLLRIQVLKRSCKKIFSWESRDLEAGKPGHQMFSFIPRAGGHRRLCEGALMAQLALCEEPTLANQTVRPRLSPRIMFLEGRTQAHPAGFPHPTSSALWGVSLGHPEMLETSALTWGAASPGAHTAHEKAAKGRRPPPRWAY